MTGRPLYSVPVHDAGGVLVRVVLDGVFVQQLLVLLHGAEKTFEPQSGCFMVSFVSLNVL